MYVSEKAVYQCTKDNGYTAYSILNSSNSRYLWVRFGVKLRFYLHCNEGKSLPFVHLTITDDKGLSSRRHERDTVRTSFNPNRSLDCYALMKPSFCHLFRHFSVTMEHHCALKVAKHLFKNKGYYHHNANDRFGFNSAIFY